MSAAATTVKPPAWVGRYAMMPNATGCGPKITEAGREQIKKKWAEIQKLIKRCKPINGKTHFRCVSDKKQVDLLGITLLEVTAGSSVPKSKHELRPRIALCNNGKIYASCWSCWDATGTLDDAANWSCCMYPVDKPTWSAFRLSEDDLDKMIEQLNELASQNTKSPS